ncbi:MAG TPA: hypothetical protein VKA94_01275 [Hyphomicrobiales bacterium]|nr:hypothetical protein [Hyphomicrobiales bacterium]
MLTPRQQEALVFIEGYISEWQRSPSYREIMDALGLKSSCAPHKLVEQLEKRGFVQRTPNSYRSIEVVRSLNAPSQEYQRGYSAGYAAALRERESADV